MSGDNFDWKVDESAPAAGHQGNRLLRHSLLGEVARLVGTGGLLVLLARAMSIEDFGVFSGVLALASSIAPFATLGSNHIMIRSIATGAASPREALGRATTVTVFGSIAGLAISVAIGVAVLHSASVQVIIVVSAAQLVPGSVFELMCNLGVGTRDLGSAFQLRTLASAFRVLALGAFWAASTSVSLLAWSYLYLGTGVLLCLISVRTVAAGWKLPLERVTVREALRGFPFSLNLAAAFVQDDVDKAMVLSISGAEVAGFYSAGYRMVGFVLVPLRAVIASTYATFFAAGANGLAQARRYAHRVFKRLAVYSVVAAAACILFSPLAALVLGHNYKQSSPVIAWLSALPLLRSVQYMYGDALTGAGLQVRRSSVLASTAALNVVLNVIWIPIYSWRGAVASTLVSEALAALLSLGLCFVSPRKPGVPVPRDAT